MPIDGGESRGLPGTLEGDYPFGVDCRRPFGLRPPGPARPARVDVLDVATGARGLWKEITPPDPAGILAIGSTCHAGRKVLRLLLSADAGRSVPGDRAEVTLAAGSRLGSYEIVAPVGAGGMGEVYQARSDCKASAREVAIKVLPAGARRRVTPGARQRFELRSPLGRRGALNHPNILAVYDIGRHRHGTVVHRHGAASRARPSASSSLAGRVRCHYDQASGRTPSRSAKAWPQAHSRRTSCTGT